jgi:CRISPR-associated protein Cas1
MVIEKGEETSTVPLSEVAVLLVSHPAVTYTNAVLSGMCANGGIFVLCNEKRMPAGMLLPLDSHFIQTERFSSQAQASLPLKKQLWKQIVKAKVIAQGRLLESITGRDIGLSMLAEKVCSGDATNVEAQASRRYWGALFGKDFRRDHEGEGPNIFLNYGYGVLRATVARAVCSAGLHPSLGLHHHNRYNSFCLADDLMEPYRPAVDGIVFNLCKEKDIFLLDKEAKAFIVKSLIEKEFALDGESRRLFDASAHTASSLSAVFSAKRKTLLLPE